MTIRMRPFHWNDDFELLRSFLIDIFKLAPYHSWIPSRLENVSFGPCGPEYQDEEDEYIKIWQEITGSDSKIVAVSFVKPSLECWIHTHPDYKYIEREIVLWIENHAKKMKSDSGDLKLNFITRDIDKKRVSLLKKLGYQEIELYGDLQVRAIDLPVPDCEIPDGFEITNAIMENDFEKYREVQSSVFSHCKVMTKKLLMHYASASFYNSELDIVAVAPDGRFAAFCTVRIDPVSRIAELEPVGTHPDFRKLGLARAVVLEGLNRVQMYNPSVICIPGAAASESARKLYESVGFRIIGGEYLWSKTI